MSDRPPFDAWISLRWSLAFVWLATAVASLLGLESYSMALLAPLPHMAAETKRQLIWAGIGLDAILGLLLLACPGRAVYGSCLAALLAMTTIATWVEPGWWLHPFGPLTKNVPIAAALVLLMQNPSRR